MAPVVAALGLTKRFGKLTAVSDLSFELEAGTVVGTGTVSNKQGSLWGSSIDNGGVGYCCIVEVRMYETIEQGAPATPYMRAGDRVRIEMLDARGVSINMIRDALLVDEAAGGFPAVVNLGGREPAEILQEARGVRPDGAVGSEGLVEAG